MTEKNLDLILSLPERLFDRARAICKERDLSVNQLVLMAINELCNAYETAGADEHSPAVPRLKTRQKAISLSEQTEELEKNMIESVLRECRFNKTRAASILGMKRTTLQYKIRRYNIE